MKTKKAPPKHSLHAPTPGGHHKAVAKGKTKAMPKMAMGKKKGKADYADQ